MRPSFTCFGFGVSAGLSTVETIPRQEIPRGFRTVGGLEAFLGHLISSISTGHIRRRISPALQSLQYYPQIPTLSTLRVWGFWIRASIGLNILAPMAFPFPGICGWRHVLRAASLMDIFQESIETGFHLNTPPIVRHHRL